MRLAVYTDYTYRRRGERIYAERAFALFLDRLAGEFEQLTILGKVDAGTGPLRYPLSLRTGFVELPYFSSLVRPWSAVPAMARSLAVLWRTLGEFDGVWVLGPHPLALGFALLARLRGRSVALGVRQDFPRYVRARHPRRRWVHLVAGGLEAAWRRLGRRTRVVTVGAALADGYDPTRTLAMSVSLVSEGDIAPAEVEAARDYDGDVLRALSVGRLETEKNPLLLADILGRLRASDPRWRLAVAGEGPLEAALRERLTDLGLADHVELLGYVNHDGTLRERYRQSHALLHVSHTEGVPQVLFEAFAARLPVVATGVGGVPAAAEGCALLIGPDDAAAAAVALQRIAGDPDLRGELIAAGVQRVRETTLESEAARVAAFLRGEGERSRSVPRRIGRGGGVLSPR